MKHLAEGQLHAFLDNEGQHGRTAERQAVNRHLTECAECRARLEAERRVRDRARAILGAAGPTSLTPPPFEAVLERATRRRVSRSGIRPTVALAWAASLALALTVGWYTRSLVLAKRAGVAPGAGDAAGAAEADVRAGAIQAAPPAARQLAQGAPPREEAAERSREGAGAVPSTAAPTAQDRPLANLAAAEAKAAADTEAPPVRVAEAPAPRAAPAPVMLRSEQRARAADVAEEAWITVTPAEAERRLGGPLATIPGLPSLGTTVFGTGPSTETRTIQMLGPGLTIELVQQRAATAATEPAARERAVPAPAAVPQVARAAGGEPGRSLTVEWEGFSVTGRALVSADSLRQLLSRLRRPE